MASDDPSSPGGAAAAPRSSVALLTDPVFGPWFAGNLLKNSGTWLYNVTAAVVVYNLTGSALVVGAVTIAQFASLAVLSPWAGALSDRHDRRRLLLASQVFAAVFAVAIAVATGVLGVDGLPGAWPVIAATAGIGVGLAFTGPALNALVPALVPSEDLESAVALTSLTFNIGRALGPGVGGVLLATLGAEVAFAVNAVASLALVAVLLRLRPHETPRVRGGDRSVRAGLRYVRDDAGLLWLLAGVGAVGFATDPVNTLAAPLAAALGGGDGLVAFLVSAFGLGAAAVAFAAGPAQRALGLMRVAGGGSGLLAAGLLAAALGPTAAVALAGFAVMGVGFLLSLTSFTTLLQRRVAEELRGRVMALWTVAFLGTRPLAAAVDGGLADLAGVRAAFAVPVAIALAGVVVARRVRHAPPPAASPPAGAPPAAPPTGGA